MKYYFAWALNEDYPSMYFKVSDSVDNPETAVWDRIYSWNNGVDYALEEVDEIPERESFREID